MQSVLRRIEVEVDPVVDEGEGVGEEVQERVAAGEAVGAVLVDDEGCRKYRQAITLIRWTNRLRSVGKSIGREVGQAASPTCKTLSASTTASTSATATSFAVEILRLPVV